MTETKICGLSTPKGITAAIENGASHVGFVFYPPSPRNVDIETAGYLASFIPDTVQTVGLFVNPDDNLLHQVLDNVKLDIIQLHGNESSVRVREIKELIGLPIMKALSIDSQDDLARCDNYTPYVDYFLFDAKTNPDISTLPGGNGLAFDWSILEDFQSPKPWFLAGGLTADNVKEGIMKLSPYGVDVSSGVESTVGIKDSSKIASFLEVVKSA